MKIAFNEIGGDSWTGGITYRKNLLKAIRAHAPEVQVALVTEKPDDKQRTEYDQIIPYKKPYSWLPETAYRFFRSQLLWDLKLQGSLNKNGGADVIFPSNFSAGAKSPALMWIPDFQILHLPQFYTPAQIASFPKTMEKAIQKARLVVLSSYDAQNDFKKFTPQYTEKTRILQFVAHIPDGLYERDPLEDIRTYNIPDRYIYVPNQFWAHKNHLILLDALKILKDRGIRPYIVFTGNPIDSRNPSHLIKILEKIAKYGLREQIALLGFVEHEHVYSLMRQAVCICNPSNFEGWSTPVEEAKSVGKRLLLSDLPVHLEQDPENARYFNRMDVEDLADNLGEIWESVPPGPDFDMEERARQNFSGRSRKFAETFLSIVKEL